VRMNLAERIHSRWDSDFGLLGTLNANLADTCRFRDPWGDKNGKRCYQ
jgi:hypothetical protein